MIEQYYTLKINSRCCDFSFHNIAEISPSIFKMLGLVTGACHFADGWLWVFSCFCVFAVASILILLLGEFMRRPCER